MAKKIQHELLTIDLGFIDEDVKLLGVHTKVASDGLTIVSVQIQHGMKRKLIY